MSFSMAASLPHDGFNRRADFFDLVNALRHIKTLFAQLLRQLDGLRHIQPDGAQLFAP